MPRKPPEMTPARARSIVQGGIKNASRKEWEHKLVREAEKQWEKELEIHKKQGTSPLKIRIYERIPDINKALPIGGDRYIAHLNIGVNIFLIERKYKSSAFERHPTPLDLIVEFSLKDLDPEQAGKKPPLHAQTIDGKKIVEIVGNGKECLAQELKNILEGKGHEGQDFIKDWFPAFITIA